MHKWAKDENSLIDKRTKTVIENRCLVVIEKVRYYAKTKKITKHFQ